MAPRARGVTPRRPSPTCRRRPTLGRRRRRTVASSRGYSAAGPPRLRSLPSCSARRPKRSSWPMRGRRRPGAAGRRAGLFDRQTAVYDISAHMVYLPNGTALEAHSGLAGDLDDPRLARKERDRGVTPPDIYNLQPRGRHVPWRARAALHARVDETKVFGRSGLFAHTYMLGPNGQSNGCVSFKRLRRLSAGLRKPRDHAARGGGAPLRRHCGLPQQAAAAEQASFRNAAHGRYP